MAASNSDLVRNAAPNFATTLANSALSSDTTITLQSTTGLPTGTGITLTIDATDPVSGAPTPLLEETVTGVVSGSTVTSLLRGEDGTSAVAHASGANVVMWFTANDWNDWQTAYLASHNQAGGIVATSPQITTGINDTNNNQVIGLGATSSAVNNIKTTNAATGNAPTITTIGSDTNIGLTITPKGTGALTLNNVFNPYKFSAYRNAGFTDGNGAFALVTFDTETFDTGSNYSVSTGKFTAPIAGFYQFNAGVSVVYNAPNYVQVALFKNGTQGATTQAYGNGTGNTNAGQNVSNIIQLAANDYVQVEHYGTGGAGITGAASTYFSGFLVSTT